MVKLSKQLEELQVPGRRRLKDIVNDVNEKGPTEGQVNEILDTLDFVVDRLTWTDAQRFSL